MRMNQSDDDDNHQQIFLSVLFLGDFEGAKQKKKKIFPTRHTGMCVCRGEESIRRSLKFSSLDLFERK